MLLCLIISCHYLTDYTLDKEKDIHMIYYLYPTKSYITTLIENYFSDNNMKYLIDMCLAFYNFNSKTNKVNEPKLKMLVHHTPTEIRHAYA